MNLREELYPTKIKHKEQFKVFKNVLNAKKSYTYICIKKRDNIYTVFSLHASHYAYPGKSAGKPIYTWICAIDLHNDKLDSDYINIYLHTLKDALKHVINSGDYDNLLILGISENCINKRTDILCDIIKNRKNIFNKYKV